MWPHICRTFHWFLARFSRKACFPRISNLYSAIFVLFDTFCALVESQLLMHEKLFPGSRLKISYQTPPLVPLFSAFLGLLLSPCVTRNSLFSLQNSITLNFSLSVSLLCSSREDMLLYNKHKIFCKYLLHTWVTRKSCFKSVFYGQKAKECCKNTAAKSN